MSKVKDMQLPNYKILSSSEAKDLLNKKDTKQLIDAVWNTIRDKNFTFLHVAQQQVDNIRLDFLNCTDNIVNLDSNRRLMINNKLTKLVFTLDNCQVLIYVDRGNICFYNSDIGYDKIVCPYLSLDAVKTENLSVTDFAAKPYIYKQSTSSSSYSHLNLLSGEVIAKLGKNFIFSSFENL
jgi:hypothetical protein